jgi:beta-galactosidase
MDSGWRFHPGDIDAPLPNKHLAAYMANKAGYARGAAKPGFDDSDWRRVDLPHDWSVEGRCDPSNHMDSGFLPRGVGWYRRHFRLEEADRGRHLALRFEGVSTHCTVYVNGHLLHRNFCGYTPFTIDISDVVSFGDQLNVVAVRVDATPIEGWWYEGAGIYRHVRLISSARIRVAADGVFVCPVKTGQEEWDTGIETTLENNTDDAVECRIISSVHDPSGAVVGSTGTAANVGPRSVEVVDQNIPIARPQLWDIDSPRLYRLHTLVFMNGETVDEVETTFGYRTIRFDADRGFFLNEHHMLLKGTCNHQDHAGVGVALPDSLHEFRIRRLREMGCNAIRCAHNPPAAELLDACDRLGMLVMDENRNFGSSPEHLGQLEAMVRRDRNHPSLILWSICNEEAIQGTPTAARIARAMVHAVKRLDASRPVTAGVSGGILNESSIADEVEVLGINYQLSQYDQFRARHPGKPIIAAETHCAYSTRGVYQTDPERRVFDSYDSEAAPWGATARQTWREITSRPWVAGLFAWTGLDYRGEPTPYEWPCVNSHWGIMDMCGFEKDAFHLHRALFTDEPFVHLLPHWNHIGRDTGAVRVMAMTNCEEVELSLNGRSLGRKPVDPIDMVDWQVVYEAGALKAVGYRRNEPVASTRVETTGPAEALGLEAHPSATRGPVPADGQYAVPVTVFAVDAAGRRVPHANQYVQFSASGAGRIIGVGNGDPNCHESDKAEARSMFNGLAQVILQTTTEAGQIELLAVAAGLKRARLVLTSADVPVRPSIAEARPRWFVRNWRMRPIAPDRPDVHMAMAEQDMNTWDRINPAEGPQSAWSAATGYAVYRATFTPPRAIQLTGGAIVLHEVIGRAEVFLDGRRCAEKSEMKPASMFVPLEPSDQPRMLTVLIRADSAPAGLGRPVEMMPRHSYWNE